MATEEKAKPIQAEQRRPLFLLPKFTSERWADGIYDAEHQYIATSLYIKQDQLLTYHQRLELETRALIFQYQQEYAKKEYELLRNEFQDIEKRLSQQEASEAEPAEHVFTKPTAPVQKKPGRKPKAGTSSSEAEEKGTSSDSTTSDGTKASKGEKKSKKKNQTKKPDTEGELESSTEDTRTTRSKAAKSLGKK